MVTETDDYIVLNLEIVYLMVRCTCMMNFIKITFFSLLSCELSWLTHILTDRCLKKGIQKTV